MMQQNPDLPASSAPAGGMRRIRPIPEALIKRWPGRQAVLVTGGTGLIGRRLVDVLVACGHAVTVLTRDTAKAARLFSQDQMRLVNDLDELAPGAAIDAIVNLAGEPISDGLWTQARRARILGSRLGVTRQIVALIDRLEHKPVLISGSAVGWYGLRGDEALTEESTSEPCFSHEVCALWEAQAIKASELGARTVLLRTGLVLDPSGGMLARLLLPFRLGLGGRFGDGRHWMSWVHIDDLVGLILHAIASPDLSGPLNGTASEPVTNRVLTSELARALHRPALLPVPAWPLRMLLGDFAKELLLSGQRVFPRKALDSGFVFQYPTLRPALAALLMPAGMTGS